MNGRMYDAVLGRMLSPDKYVQDGTNTQAYNRYSYVMNNPLKYTDPSGWLRLADAPVEANIDDTRGGSGGGSRYIGGLDLTGGGNLAMVSSMFYASNQLNSTYYNWSTGQYMNGKNEVSFSGVMGELQSKGQIRNASSTEIASSLMRLCKNIESVTDVDYYNGQRIINCFRFVTDGLGNPIKDENGFSASYGCFLILDIGLPTNTIPREAGMTSMFDDPAWLAPPIIGRVLGGIFGKVFGGAVEKEVGHVFYSGGKLAQQKALEYATNNGYKIIDNTIAGKTLTWLTDKTSYSITKPLWQGTSYLYAKSANSDIAVFLNLPGLNSTGIFFKTELPILESKGLPLYYFIIH